METCCSEAQAFHLLSQGREWQYPQMRYQNISWDNYNIYRGKMLFSHSWISQAWSNSGKHWRVTRQKQWHQKAKVIKDKTSPKNTFGKLQRCDICSLPQYPLASQLTEGTKWLSQTSIQIVQPRTSLQSHRQGHEKKLAAWDSTNTAFNLSAFTDIKSKLSKSD